RSRSALSRVIMLRFRLAPAPFMRLFGNRRATSETSMSLPVPRESTPLVSGPPERSSNAALSIGNRRLDRGMGAVTSDRGRRGLEVEAWFGFSDAPPWPYAVAGKNGNVEKADAVPAFCSTYGADQARLASLPS